MIAEGRVLGGHCSARTPLRCFPSTQQREHAPNLHFRYNIKASSSYPVYNKFKMDHKSYFYTHGKKTHVQKLVFSKAQKKLL